ncbi:replication initiation protein, partial [Vibrio xuii]
MLRTVETSPGNFMTLDFIPVSDPNRNEFEQDFLYSNPTGYVDHTNPNVSYRSTRRRALALQIHSLDLSDLIEQKNEHPCEKLLRLTRRHGDFAPHMIRAFTNILERKNYVTALSMLEDADKRLRADGIRFARTDEEIVELAKAKSQAFAKQLLKIEDIQERFAKSELLLADLGLSFRPELVKQKQKNDELDSLIQRA